MTSETNTRTKKITTPTTQLVISIIAGIGIVYLGIQIGRLQKQNSNALEIAPDFNITQFDSGETLSLSDFEGKGIVINFWAPWCLPCKEEMPLLEASSKAYAESGVVFLGVNTGDDLENARAFIDIHEVTYVNGYDSTHQMEEDFQVVGIPTTWFINADGEVIYKYMGPLDEYTLNQIISRITVH